MIYVERGYKMCKVSCIVPIYNVENYVDKCIESLINQEYPLLEIILVDDGSNDYSGKICEQYAEKDSRIIVIHKKNGGLSSARNAGLDIAQGEYILFVDGDDCLASNTVEYLVDLQMKSEHSLDLIQFRYKEIMKDEEIIVDDIEDEDTQLCVDKKMMFENLYKIGGMAASACTKMYHKRLFENLRFKEGIIHEDEYMITDILERAKNCLYVNRELYYYIMRPGSIVKSDFTPKKMEVFIAIQYRRDYLKKVGYQDLLDKENTRYFITLMNLYCDARKNSYYEVCKRMENRLKQLLDETTINIAGKMKFFEKICRVNKRFIYIYYFLRKVTRKI